MVLRPAKLPRRGKRTEFGGYPTQSPICLNVAERTRKHAPCHALAQGVRCALPAYRVGNGFIGGTLSFFAQASHLFGNRDFYGADFHACTAHGAGSGQVAGFVQPQQMRRQNFANGAGIGGAVGRAADAGVHRAVVHARAAADTLQRAAHLLFAVCLAAAVVQQHEVHFLRTVQLVGTARAGNHVEIGGDVLADGTARQQAVKRWDVGQFGHHFLNAGNGDVHGRHGGA